VQAGAKTISEGAVARLLGSSVLANPIANGIAVAAAVMRLRRLLAGEAELDPEFCLRMVASRNRNDR